MKLVSVNVALARDVPQPRGGVVSTAIFKAPVQGRVRVGQLHLAGDWQVDREFHGGLNKAVYAYPAEHYPFWEAELGRSLPFGQLGENLSISGLLEDEAGIGDVIRVGSAVLQVTQPRMPCFKLGLRMDDAGFPKRFLHSGRLGFYLRVLEEGEVGAGDDIAWVTRDLEGPTIRALWEMCFGEAGDVDQVRRALGRDVLAPEWRQPLERRLRDAEAGA